MTVQEKISAAEKKLISGGVFEKIDEIAYENQKKVMNYQLRNTNHNLI